jgi:hypothetical protein
LVQDLEGLMETASHSRSLADGDEGCALASPVAGLAWLKAQGTASEIAARSSILPIADSRASTRFNMLGRFTFFFLFSKAALRDSFCLTELPDRF